MNLSWHSSCTEGATCIFAILYKVQAPHLNRGSSILRTMSWLDGFDSSRSVVEELGRTGNISEIATQ